MKILLTGYKGFIGSNMLKILRSENHEVTTFEWGEILPTVKNHDWVIHIGANSSTTERDIEKIMEQNYDFSVKLLNECISNNVNFQYSSSASVYGLRKSNFTEDAKVDPRNPYAWTKYLFERYASNTDHSNIVVQGFRYFNVYGPGEDNKKDMASPFHKFNKQFLETGKIKLFDNSHKYYRDFVPVDQVCKTHMDFFTVKESGIWNVGTGNPKSFLDVALSIAPITAIEYITMPDILKDNYQEYTCADVTKINKTLKFKENQL